MQRKWTSVALTAIVAIVVATSQLIMAFLPSHAANDGTLDAAFDTDGIVATDFGAADFGYGVTIQSDNKLIAVGYAYTGQSYDFALARYNPDGSRDPAFGTDGKVTTDFFSEVEQANAAVLQSDGKIIVVGLVYLGTAIDFALARYNSNGSLDTSFGMGGKVTTDFGPFDHSQAVVLQNDGKIVVMGLAYINDQYDFVLVRYNPDGSLDTSFDGDGKLITDFGGEDHGYTLGIQSDGRLVVAGYTDIGGTLDFALARYTSDGSLDSSFDGDGKVITDFGGEDYAYSLGIQSDGKITIAGLINFGGDADFLMARYNPDGSLDNSFGSNGTVITDFGGDDRGDSLVIQDDGKLTVAGQVNLSDSYDFALARYNSNGSLDTSFGAQGRVITDLGADDIANALAVQADGNLVVAGFSDFGSSADFALARYYGNGQGPDLTPVSTFTPPATQGPPPTNTPTATATSGTPGDPVTPTPTPTATNTPQVFNSVTPSTPDTTPIATPSGTPGDALTPTPTGTGTPATATPTPTVPAGDGRVTVQPGQSATLVYRLDTGCSTTIEFPAGAVSEPTTFVYQPLTTPTRALGAYRFAGLSFTLTAYRHDVPLEHFVFNQPIKLTIACASGNMDGLDEAQAQLLAYDPVSGQWSADGITLVERSLSTHTLVFMLAHLSEYALVAPVRSNDVYLPTILVNRP